MRVRPLAGNHDREAFDCGEQSLNAWIRRIAHQHQSKSLSRTYVASLDAAPDTICGYYALTLTELEGRHLPAAARKRLPRRVPGVRLGRLAVDRRFQGMRLGELLLVDALNRAARVYAEAGGIGLFVDALNESAANYYRRFGFQSLPDSPLMLFLPCGTVRT